MKRLWSGGTCKNKRKPALMAVVWWDVATCMKKKHKFDSSCERLGILLTELNYEM